MTDASHEIGREADARPAPSGQSCSSRNSPAVCVPQQRAAVSAAGAFSGTKVSDVRRWTPEQLTLLETLLHAPWGTIDYGAFGAPLGKSSGAVERRLQQMRRERGVHIPKPEPNRTRVAKKPGSRGRGRPFTREEDAEMWRLHAQGMTAKKIAPLVGRNASVVSERLGRLALVGGPSKPDMATRRCLNSDCRVAFQYDRNSENYFLCERHRAASASPYAPGGSGSTGKRVRAVMP